MGALADGGTYVNLVGLEEAGALPCSACWRPAYDEQSIETKEQIISYLINEAGANVNAQGGQFQHALNAAGLRNTPEILRILIESGANIKVEDKMGRTSAHLLRSVLLITSSRL